MVKILDLNSPLIHGTNYLLTLARLVNIFLEWVGIIAFIFVLYGGFLYLTAGGDSAAAAKARGIIINAMIGLIIIFLSYILIRTAIKIPTCDTSSGDAGQCLSK